MLNVIVSKKEFKLIISGKTNQIHKPLIPYYTSRFTTRFGVIGDPDIVEEICIVTAKGNWKPENRRVAMCTLSVDNDEDYKARYTRIPPSQERYILTIHSLREFDPEIDMDADETTREESIPYTEVISILKKKKLCLQKKKKGCNEECTACSYFVEDDDLLLACISASLLLGRIGGNKYYQEAVKKGRKKAYKEIDSFEGLKAPTEVVNTEGFDPYCQVCRSTTSIYSMNGEKNQFCGKCGTLLNWDSVKNNEDNYQRLKEDSESEYEKRNYRLRRQAIKEFLERNKTSTVVMKNFNDISVDAIVDTVEKNKSKRERKNEQKTNRS